MEKMNEIVLFETKDKAVTLSVPVEQETVWLNRNQMAELFDESVGWEDKDDGKDE